ncbi:MAG: hypothetical protein V5B34_05320 [Accumulibacter sp.]
MAARAGHDRRATINLWQKMGLPGSGRPPEWQSTHAATANRIVHVRRYAERVRLADEAAGKTP